jgi:hypothetical protein
MHQGESPEVTTGASGRRAGITLNWAGTVDTFAVSRCFRCNARGERSHVAARRAGGQHRRGKMSKRTALAFGIGASLLLAAGTANAASNCTAEIDALQQQLGTDEGANARTGPSDSGVQQPSPGTSADTSASGSSTGTTTMDSNSSTTADSSSTGTTDNNANATIGANGSGVQQPQPEANATTGTSTDSGTTTGTDTSNGSSVATNNENTGANATIGPTDPGVQQPGGSATSADNSSTSGSSNTMSNGSSSTTADSSSGSMSNGTSTMPSGTVTETSRSGTLNVDPSARSSALASLEKAKLYAQSGEEEACMSEVNSAKQTLGVQ